MIAFSPRLISRGTSSHSRLRVSSWSPFQQRVESDCDIARAGVQAPGRCCTGHCQLLHQLCVCLTLHTFSQSIFLHSHYYCCGGFRTHSQKAALSIARIRSACRRSHHTFWAFLSTPEICAILAIVRFIQPAGGVRPINRRVVTAAHVMATLSFPYSHAPGPPISRTCPALRAACSRRRLCNLYRCWTSSLSSCAG